MMHGQINIKLRTRNVHWWFVSNVDISHDRFSV